MPEAAVRQRGPGPPPVLTPAQVLGLQRAVGNRAVGRLLRGAVPRATPAPPAGAAVLQRKAGFEFELTDVETRRQVGAARVSHAKGTVLKAETGYSLTADQDNAGHSQLELIIQHIDEDEKSEVDTLLKETLPHAVESVRKIITASYAGGAAFGPGEWVSAAAAIGGRANDRLRAMDANAEGVHGQLQMTAGVRMNGLEGILSGRKVRELGETAGGAEAAQFLHAYGDGALWSAALLAVNENQDTRRLPGVPHKQQLASVVSLLATTPLNARTRATLDYPKAGAGKLLARTDFAEIAMQLSDTVKAVITPRVMEDLVLATINGAHAFQTAVAAADPIFPAALRYSAAGIPAMNSLSIGTWVRTLVPTPGKMWGYWSGKDLLTKKHFPGTRNQKDALESMGGFGDKTDPGDRPVFEFRSFSQVPLVGLPRYVDHALAFLKDK